MEVPAAQPDRGPNTTVPEVQAAGIRNYANTCFMSVMLQCFMSVPDLVQHFSTESYIKEISERASEQQRELAAAVAELVEAMCKKQCVGVERLYTICKRLKKDLFGDAKHQDAQEFFSFLVDQLHDAFKRQDQSSTLRSLFQGDIHSTLTCTRCGALSHSDDPFWVLPLAIKGNSIQELLADFEAPEYLCGDEQWRCPNCSMLVDATKRCKLRLPKVLVIHLRCQVCPSLRLGCYGLLAAVVYHKYGSASGHYTCFRRHVECTDLWLKCDDSVVCQVPVEKVVNTQAYICVYQQEALKAADLEADDEAILSKQQKPAKNFVEEMDARKAALRNWLHVPSTRANYVQCAFEEDSPGRAGFQPLVAVEEDVGLKLLDVHGVGITQEFTQIVDFLREPEHLMKVGAKMPKCILRSGLPDVVVPLIAKALAGEAGVPCIQSLLGVDASALKQIFQQAKDKSPCIVCINEIDAIGRKRVDEIGDGSDEPEQTLHQLLTELDSLDVSSSVIAVAASSRPDLLSKALLDRFDRPITMKIPDLEGRMQILAMLVHKKKLADDVTIRDIAQGTSGFSGANLEKLIKMSESRATTTLEGAIGMNEINEVKSLIVAEMIAEGPAQLKGAFSQDAISLQGTWSQEVAALGRSQEDKDDTSSQSEERPPKMTRSSVEVKAEKVTNAAVASEAPQKKVSAMERPKKPVAGAYGQWLREQKGKLTRADAKDAFASLTEDEKKVYKDRFNEKMEEFNAKLSEYSAQVPAQMKAKSKHRHPDQDSDDSSYDLYRGPDADKEEPVETSEIVADEDINELAPPLELANTEKEKKEDRPKRPVGGAFGIFCQGFRGKRCDAKTKWASLSEEERKPFQDEERRQMKLWKEHKNNASTEEAASAGHAVAQQPRQKKRKAPDTARTCALCGTSPDAARWFKYRRDDEGNAVAEGLRCSSCVVKVQRYAHHVATEDKPKILREATEESIWNRAKNSRRKTQLRRAILSVGLKQAAVDLLEESQTTGHSSVRYSLEDPAEDVWAYDRYLAIHGSPPPEQVKNVNGRRLVVKPAESLLVPQGAQRLRKISENGVSFAKRSTAGGSSSQAIYEAISNCLPTGLEGHLPLLG